MLNPIDEDFKFGCLRALAPSDASGMLEWMHDENVASVFQANFAEMQLGDVEDFIVHSYENGETLHFAVDDGCGYMGTVSLKHIDETLSCAEYAISMRSAAHGTGLAAKATEDILDYAFETLGLHRVFLNVRADNMRARRFYDKMGFSHEGTSRDGMRTPDGYCDLEWYSMLNEEFKGLQNRSDPN